MVKVHGQHALGGSIGRGSRLRGDFQVGVPIGDVEVRYSLVTRGRTNGEGLRAARASGDGTQRLLCMIELGGNRPSPSETDVAQLWSSLIRPRPWLGVERMLLSGILLLLLLLLLLMLRSLTVTSRSPCSPRSPVVVLRVWSSRSAA